MNKTFFVKAITRISIVLIFVFTGVSSYAQLQAPKQTDTLFIQSMTYHYDNIRPENWPFKYVIRKADAFVFGSQEFKILYSKLVFKEKIFTLTDGTEESILNILPQNGTCVLKFSGYEFVCSSGKELDNITENQLDPRESFPGLTKEQTVSKPNAHLKGRSVDGALERPAAYTVRESGIVVVTIWVDNYGKVQKAVAGADGTTITDKKLWAAARKAAMETHFTMDSSAPALQQGSITYIFRVM